jgi:hypothetical protein
MVRSPVEICLGTVGLNVFVGNDVGLARWCEVGGLLPRGRAWIVGRDNEGYNVDRHGEEFFGTTARIPIERTNRADFFGRLLTWLKKGLSRRCLQL